MTDERIFLFDLDSTITRKEILPTIAEKLGRGEEMRKLTEDTMNGGLPFKQSFLRRVDMLKDIPVSEVSQEISNISLNDKIVEFIKKYHERCYVVTGNLDIWINPLMAKMNIFDHTYCSHAVEKDNIFQYVSLVVDKKSVIDQIVQPFVAIGDGNNDAEMIDAAEVGIGYGGVRSIAPSVLECASDAFYYENKLVEFLERLV